MARRKSEKIIEENNMAKITFDEQLEGYKEFIHHEITVETTEEPTE